MYYFEKVPEITYKGKKIKDITRRIVVRDKIKENIELYEPYIVKDGETPETIAFDFYGNSNYHWIIILMNNIIDPFYDWILSEQEVLSLTEKNYDDIRAVHHYEDNDGRIVHSSDPEATPITNIEYERALNEQKREIKIIKPIYLDEIEKEYLRLLNGEV